MAHTSALDEDGAIVGINVTPLVDIILVILIIFMVSAELIKTQGIAVEKPTAATGGAVEESLAITLGADSTLYIAGTVMTDHDQAAAVLRDHVARNSAVKVLITADTRIPYGEVVTVIDLARAAGIRDFSIAVKPPGS